MNRINSYDISKLSFHDIKELEENYISQVKNKNIKKLDIKINENDLLINIEPYYLKSDKWDELNNILKLKRVNFWFRDDDVGDTDIIVRTLKQPTCNKVEINGNTINFDVEKELGVEIVGETKFKIGVEDDEEQWEDLTDEVTEETEKEIEKEVDENYI